MHWGLVTGELKIKLESAKFEGFDRFVPWMGVCAIQSRFYFKRRYRLFKAWLTISLL